MSRAPLRVVDKRPRQTTQPTLLPKKLRAEWMDVMAVDPEITALEFRVACVIGGFVNARTGATFASRSAIARRVCVTERAVEKAISKLEARGYLIVKRPDYGSFIRNGKAVSASGGRGKANGFSLAFERSNLSSTFDGKKLERAFDLLTSERSNKEAGNVEPPFAPTLPSSKENTAGARGSAAMPSPGHLGIAGDRLRKAIGEDLFRSWFSRVVLISVSEGRVKLGAPSPFAAKRIDQEFSRHVLQAWRHEFPNIQTVSVEANEGDCDAGA